MLFRSNLKSSASVAGQQNTNNDKSPTNIPVTSPKNPSQKSSAIQPDATRERSNNLPLTISKKSVSTAATGSIAYVRGSKEIRLISPDGGNDRRILVYPDATEVSGINELAWRPDGKEIAFSSGHDEIFSIYDADLYAVKPDGTGLRKLTNAPDRSELARYPKGSVASRFATPNRFTNNRRQAPGFLLFTSPEQTSRNKFCSFRARRKRSSLNQSPISVNTRRQSSPSRAEIAGLLPARMSKPDVR